MVARFSSIVQPSVRIMTYSYEFAVAFSKPKMGIGHFASNLLFGLHLERNSLASSVMLLMFVCHRLGRVSLKQALITITRQKDNYIM